MNRKTLTIIVLQALIIIIMFWLLVFYGKDEYEAYSQEEQEEEIASPPRVSTDQGATVVTLSTETQRQSGIVVSSLRSANYQSELSAFGTVVNLDGLSELRTRYLAARADAGVVRASISSTQKEYQRMLQLNRDDRNISDRAVAAAEAAWRTDEARLAAAETAAAGIRDTMRQQWGETLTAWATQQPAGEALQRLLQYKDVLLQITLPLETATPDKNATLMVEPSGAAGKAVRATFVSPAPQADAAIQGKTFFYKAPADSLRVGMRITAHFAQPGKTATGAIIPASAIVWYGGKAWIYQKQSEDRFIRRQVSTEREAGEGWFNAGTIKPGDAVVTSGAQLLLSEEFKYQITNENED
jgi:hypothetical protein